MAITAKFSADFGNFNAEVDKASKSLGDLEVRTQKAAAAIGVEASQIEKIRAQLAAGIDPKMIKTLSDDIPAAAAQTSKAMAGTTKSLDDVSKGLNKIAPASDAATAGLGDLDRMATRIIERAALLFAIKGSFQFVESLFTGAQKLEQTAAELQLTTDKVQQLQFIATETYIPVNLFATAIGDLTKKIVEDNGGAVSAVRSLGLSLEQLKSEDAGKRFDDIAIALSNVKDTATRLGYEFQLLGTDKLDPAIQKFAQLKANADTLNQSLSKEQVEALADVAKGWDHAKEAAHNYFAGIAADAVLASQGKGSPGLAGRAISGLGSLAEFAFPAIGNLRGASSFQGLTNSALNGQLTNVPAPNAFGTQAPAALPGSFGGALTKTDLDYLKAVEKTITDEVEHRITLEREEAALQKDMWTKSLETAKLISKEFEKQIALLAKEMDTAITAEFEARKANAAAQGFDVAGNRLGAPGSIGSPEDVYEKTIRGLANQRERLPGLVTTEQEEQAFRRLRQSLIGNKTDAYGNPVLPGADAYGNVPGFAEGGVVTVGEHGPERVELPYGSKVLPNSLAGQFTVSEDMLTPEHGGTRGYPGSWQSFFEAADKGTWFSQAPPMKPQLFNPGLNAVGTGTYPNGLQVGAIHINGDVDSNDRVNSIVEQIFRRLQLHTPIR